VESGDKVDIQVWAKFRKKTSYSRSGVTGAIASILGNAYVGTADGIDILTKATQTFQNGLSWATAASTGNGTDAVALPYAYVYYLLYDRSFNFVTAGWQRVTSAGGFDTGNEAFSTHEQLVIPTVSISEPGYMYVFVSNESENTEVWFDDLSIQHQQSPVVAGADYYPFGMAINERSITREPYRFGYQGQYAEKNDSTGWSEFSLRFYDAKIARWLTGDPFKQYYSPYKAMGNLPHLLTDPSGGEAGVFTVIGKRIAPLGRVGTAARSLVEGFAKGAMTSGMSAQSAMRCPKCPNPDDYELNTEYTFTDGTTYKLESKTIGKAGWVRQENPNAIPETEIVSPSGGFLGWLAGNIDPFVHVATTISSSLHNGFAEYRHGEGKFEQWHPIRLDEDGLYTKQNRDGSIQDFDSPQAQAELMSSVINVNLSVASGGVELPIAGNTIVNDVANEIVSNAAEEVVMAGVDAALGVH
jgi:RHS repeat-associated protein